jgi:hypothetical protein
LGKKKRRHVQAAHKTLLCPVFESIQASDGRTGKGDVWGSGLIAFLIIFSKLSFEDM